MHCVSLYPTQDEDLNLNSIYYLKNKLFKICRLFRSFFWDYPSIAVANYYLLNYRKTFHVQ